MYSVWRTCFTFFETVEDRRGHSCFKKDRALPDKNNCAFPEGSLEHLTLEMIAYGRQKPAFSHFVARIFKKILAEQLTHFIR